VAARVGGGKGQGIQYLLLMYRQALDLIGTKSWVLDITLGSDVQKRLHWSLDLCGASGGVKTKFYIG
jgi:hypothetical protein